MTGTVDWLRGEDEPAADPIAIIGLACRFPGAMSAGEFWRNLAGGVESAVLDEAELFDSELFGISAREAGLLDPQQRMFLELAYTALQDGAYDPFRHEGDIGVFAGVASADRCGCVSTLTSARLHLSGPSVTLHTACSTSLVALHLAGLALRTGECGMALSGGVDLVPPGAEARASAPGRACSPDGHCRAFDAKADGTAAGSGGTVVLLKRLRDALADGDHIRAVLLGDAVSHDGQAKVVARSLATAGVDPRTIGYVEADGSGTLLGDYTEISALSSVFRQYSGDAGWCAIGAVTTNIGHLGAAAGGAGLVKTVLALERGFIPASLNYETANPRIDFGNNPFYVNTALARWESDGVPRRASVSSLGMAGTNAHAILEEPPRRAPGRRADGRPSHLLLLSARTSTALDTAARRLSEHLAGLPDGRLPGGEDARVALADVAYTLRVGRPSYQERLAVTATSPAEAAAALVSAARVITGTAPAKPPELILLFPGEGASAGMATQLYQTEPTVHEAIDECAEVIRDHVGADIREVMLHADVGSSADLLRRAAIARSALFSYEYALALFWRDLGVTPVGMVGHGVGEYVAATLAEACTLSDTLAALCADSVPRLRFRSADNGDQIPGSAAAGPAYWTRQGREAIRFPDYLAPVTRAADPLLLECGPGEQLSTLARSHLGRPVMAVPSLPRRVDGGSDLGALYSAVGRLWASGAKLDLASFGSPGRRVPLPTYPWERQYVTDAQVTIAPDPVSDIAPDTATSPAAADGYVMPRDQLEATIARLWAQALGVDRISVTDDFFEIGGNSLVAARLMSMVQDQTGIRLPARDFFGDPTVAGVAAAIAELRKAGDASRVQASPWFGRHPRPEGARVTLFCLPFSGGGASAFNAWRGLFPPEIEVCPVHLPGREERIEEPAAISAMVIAGALAERIDRPFALYGHSMGARLGFEVLRELAGLEVRAALRFYPAASRPPDVSSTLYESVLLPDEAFLDVLIRRLGAPAELRDTPELRQLLLPVLRSDLDWGHRYRYHPGPPLATTILALSGESDTEATPQQMAGWSRHGERFSQRTLRGGHFFIKTAAPQLAELLTHDLLDALAEPASQTRPPSSMTP